MIKPFLNNYPITSPFGPRTIKGKAGFHNGIDFGCPTGTPILAVESGTVVVSTFDQYGATWIRIDNGKGVIWEYLHFSENRVKVGDRVVVGQVIGLSGGAAGTKGAGFSTGPHLHLGKFVNGKPVDYENEYNQAVFFTKQNNIDSIKYFKQNDMSLEERNELNQLHTEKETWMHNLQISFPNKIREYSSDSKPIISRPEADVFIDRVKNCDLNNKFDYDSIFNDFVRYLGEDNLNYRKYNLQTQENLEAVKKELLDLQDQLQQVKKNFVSKENTLKEKDSIIQELQNKIAQSNTKQEGYSLSKALVGWEKNGLVTGILSISAVSIAAVIIQFIPQLAPYKDVLVQALTMVGFAATTSQAAKNVVKSIQ